MIDKDLIEDLWSTFVGFVLFGTIIVYVRFIEFIDFITGGLLFIEPLD